MPSKVKYDAINLMLPTRGRVQGLKRFVESAITLADNPGLLRFSFLTDHDDAPTNQWTRSLLWQGKHTIVDHETDGPHLARYYNRLYYESIFQELGTLVSMVADDMYFETKGWDSLVLDRMNKYDGRAFVYGDDCNVQHEKMAVNCFTSRLVVDGTCTGEFMWGRWRANIIDVVWTEIARRAGILEYIPELKIVHDHNNKKAVKDATHLRLRQHYTFAAGRWHILNPYIDIAVRALKDTGVAR